MRIFSVLAICAIGICFMLGTSVSTLPALASTAEATVNIDPDTLNIKSGGEWITAYIEPLDPFNVSDIDISTVFLENVIPAESDSKYGFVKDPEIKDRDGNGIPELMVKFDRYTVVNYILSIMIHESPLPKTSIELTVSGKLYDGTPFEGSDWITVITS